MKASLLALALIAGCGSSTPKNAEVAGGYETQLMACVAASHTRAEYETCKCDVNKRYQRPCSALDGGAP